ncbi:MAG: SDR family oxidoreductase [Novosphingobium sp.]|uniref:SDR family NAD(P)-dependent oxidoreductase n=1 Tax=Novosphingobium sp. TaxID=1874826 RepID=UPI0027347636|nr:SDR family oxidoreductase [Novosphingobium sp.]MDP3550772.1 SDR family oxidoreductase [Novosphingobium sp.]
MGDLAGRRALITGASSGLGAHFARVLAGEGVQVVLAARRIGALSTLAETITACGGQADAVQLDVADPNSIAAITPTLGTIDILVNNAGVVREANALDQSEADWDCVVDTNLKGLFLLAQATARAMKARGVGGSIINIASILGIRQGGGVLPYAVSKAGVIQFTKVMALELARYGIRVNAIAPGYFATEINSEFWESEPGKALVRRIPQRRLGHLPDLDGPLLLLASDASRYMTGSVIVVDGGHLVSGL